MALGNAFMINPDKCGKLVAQKVDLFGFGHRSKFRGRTPKRPNPVGQHTSLTRPLDLLGKKKNTTKLSLDLPPSLATWLPSALLRLEDLNALHYAVLLFLAERTALGR